MNALKIGWWDKQVPSPLPDGFAPFDRTVTC